MYLQLGQSVVVRAKEVLGVFDFDNTTYCAKAARFVNRAEKEGRVVLCTDDLPKSMVVCGNTVYLSPFSTATLLRRWNGKHTEQGNDPMEVTQYE
ncbi:MAG: DUF370 domain-containing protein [Oscillospiraceae bacterium]|nr:DUF370 domain-containing protein [Oscillospiraceae bacterium]